MKCLCNESCPYLFDNEVCIHKAYYLLKDNNFQQISINGKSCFLITFSNQKNIIYNIYHGQEIIPNPRVITFVDSNKTMSYNIIGKKEFYDIYKKHNFIYPYYENNDKTKIFLYSLEEIYSFLESDSSKIYNYEITKDLTDYYDTQLIQLLRVYPKTINNLTLTSTLYSKCKENEEFFIDYQKGRQLLFDHLRQFVDSDENYFYFTGPIGIGKTISLLYFQRTRIGISFCLYINLKYLKSTYNSNHFMENLLKELVILFSQSKTLYFTAAQQISAMYFHHKKEWSFFIFLKEMINYLVSNYNQNFIFIFDQYKPRKDEDFFISKVLKNKIIEYNKSIHVIVCSSINDKDIGNALKNYWKHGTYKDNLPYKYYLELISKITFEKMYKNLNIVDADLFNYLPHYMKQMINLPENKITSFLSETEKHIKKKIFELYKNNYLECYNNISNLLKETMNTPLDKKTFINIIDCIPLKYITVNKENDEYTLSYQFKFVKQVLMNLFAECHVKMESQDIQNSLIPISELSGDCIEKIIHSYILQKGFFKLSKMTKILVDSVISLNIIKISENVNKSRKSKKVNKNEQQPLLKLVTTDNLYFVQDNKNAKHYDSAILFYKKGRWQFILFQITLLNNENKRLSMSNILKDCYEIKENIKKSINTNINIDINDFHFFNIFCLENFDALTYQYCQNNKINFVIYSVLRNQFVFNSIEINQNSSVKFGFIFYNDYPLLNNLRNTLNIVHNTEIFLEKKTKRDNTNDKGIYDILNFDSIQTFEQLIKILDNKEKFQQIEDYYTNILFFNSKENDFKTVCKYTFIIYKQFGYRLTFLGCEKSQGNCACSNLNTLIVYQIKQNSYILFKEFIYDLDKKQKINNTDTINSICYTLASEISIKFYFLITQKEQDMITIKKDL